MQTITRRAVSFAKLLCSLFGLCALTGPGSTAQPLTTIFSFDGTDGSVPYAGLVQATNGALYGTTYSGGPNCPPTSAGCGTIFKITPSGTLTTLYSFCSQPNCTDGWGPEAALVQATNGKLYGTTTSGGDYDGGTVFQITSSGTLTTLYSFCSQANCADGSTPFAGLVQAPNGNLYGTTSYGGLNGYGTIFKITPAGALTTLYSFCAQIGCPDGAYPTEGLVQSSNRYLYGTTFNGGANGLGTIFKITTSGTLTKLYSFCSQPNCTDGRLPSGALIQAVNGYLYGTTYAGGVNDFGTVFKITPSGTLTTLYSFCSQANCLDGWSPSAGLVQATDGNFYGTTSLGGFGGGGTIFQITSTGTLTTLYGFCTPHVCPDGSYPEAALVQHTNGPLYGTTEIGGAYISDGTVFSLSVGLGPFVKTLSTSGKVGSAVKILGTDLIGATSVTFNGTSAIFTVHSNSFVVASVPAGATTGPIQVVTPSGTLSSNVPFRVLP